VIQLEKDKIKTVSYFLKDIYLSSNQEKNMHITMLSR